MTKNSSRLGVCSWSLRPESPQNLIDQLADIGILRIQAALDPVREKPAVWGEFGKACATRGVEIVSGMFGTKGEDYTTLESIKRTGGLVPDETWDENWRNIQETARIAQDLGLTLVGFHAGFLPHETSDPQYQKIKGRIVKVAEQFANRKIELALETGQESAPTLKAFLDDLACPNVGVNFDPANMILYDKGDPIEAVRTLGSYIRQCHIKDARRTKTPGTWGEEVTAGTGEVNWKDFFAALKSIGFKGNCCIEREAGEQRVADIKTAHTMLKSHGIA